jgi:hypothetical protein
MNNQNLAALGRAYRLHQSTYLQLLHLAEQAARQPALSVRELEQAIESMAAMPDEVVGHVFLAQLGLAEMTLQ